MWSDNETKEDLLGFKVHADLVKGVVLDKDLSPVIIGVFGHWGSGKSSILKIVQDELNGEDDIACLYFNGWLFEGYDDAKAALLESILEKLADDKKFGPKVKDKALKLIKSVNWMRTVRLGFQNVGLPVLAAYLTGGTSLIPTLSEKLSSIFGNYKENPEELIKKLQSEDTSNVIDELIKENQEEPEIGVRKFREKFNELLKETNIKSLVILIDDLDRCSHERILENLEAIKLFLNVENTAFIIGADQRLVEQAVKSKYKDDDRLVKEYLEKVIQIPYHLPPLSDSEVETYMALLFCKKELTKVIFKQILTNFHLFRETDRYSVFSHGKIKEFLESIHHPLPPKLNERLIMVHNIAPLITKGLEGNPRQIKRYLNAFILRKKLAAVAKLSEFKDDILAKLMILEYTENSLFKQLYNWQANGKGYPPEIEKLEKICQGKNPADKIKKQLNENWSKEKAIRWAMLEPSLSKIDLRDYFWITRDKLSESISGSLPIPPVVKKTIQDLYALSPTQSITNKKIESIKGVFGELELRSFYEALKSRTINEPDNPQHYNIYHILIEKGFTDSINNYVEVLELVKDSAPSAPAIQLNKLAASHPALLPIIEKIEKNTSPFGKALKLQRIKNSK